jgi:hypothetical protein
MDVDLDSELRQLREQATTHVARWSIRTPLRTALFHLTRGRIDKRPRLTLGDHMSVPNGPPSASPQPPCFAHWQEPNRSIGLDPPVSGSSARPGSRAPNLTPMEHARRCS